ncbi:MAG TPA: hypothetical protein VFM32_05620 [Spongiibacteraceae bacterium]|nr:hypothetical protein [Spongiibacteraceae bacterium]
MKTETTIDVKNLCSRKLWELASSHEIDANEMRSIASELQLRRHYLSELEHLLTQPTTQRH